MRCWRRDNWRRAVWERNAWNDWAEDPEELFGWADINASRIHMRLDQCNTLGRFRGKDLLGWDRQAQIEAANSLDTFAHEIQHFVLPDADEAEVECAASRTLGRVARQLGASVQEVEPTDRALSQ